MKTVTFFYFWKSFIWFDIFNEFNHTLISVGNRYTLVCRCRLLSHSNMDNSLEHDNLEIYFVLKLILKKWNWKCILIVICCSLQKTHDYYLIHRNSQKCSPMPKATKSMQFSNEPSFQLQVYDWYKTESSNIFIGNRKDALTD